MELVSEEELWDYFDDILDEEQVNDYIWDDIQKFNDGWDELRDALNGLDDVGNYCYYIADGSFSYRGVTQDDVSWMKDRAYEAMCNNDYWESEESEPEREDQCFDSQADDDMELDESVDFNGLYTACSGAVNVLMEEDAKNKREAYIEFAGVIHGLIK